MVMGTRRRRQRQQELFYSAELAETPGHPFYTKLNEVLDAAGFDAFCEERCQRFYDDKLGRPSPHQFETGAMRSLHVRGLDEVRKKLLLQAAACNLALLLRTQHGAGTPRGLSEAQETLWALTIALLAAPKRHPTPFAGRIRS